MKAFGLMFQQPWVATLGWTLLHFLWQGAALAALLGVIGVGLRKRSAHARYLAGCLTLLAMAVTPWITFLHLRGQALPRPAFVVAAVPAEETMVTIDPAPGMSEAGARRGVEPAVRPAARMSVARQLEPALPGLVAGWLSAVLLLSLRLMVGWVGVGRIRHRGAELLGDEWQERLSRLRRELGISRPVRLCRSCLVEVPTVLGWLRPVILIPVSALTNLTPGQLEAILAHELAHIRRHDFAANVLQRIVETLLFYHPAVWWVSRQIGAERENCCDDVTVALCGDRVNYALALAAMEEWRGTSLDLRLAASGAPLLGRIRRLLGLPAEANRSGWWLAGMIGLLTMAALVVAGWSRVWADEGNPKPAAPASRSATNEGGAKTNQDVSTRAKAVEGKSRYWRAVEGLLGQDLTQIDGVEWAEVTITEPRGNLPAGAQDLVSASVSVQIRPGRELNDAILSAIADRVLGEVDGLKPERISVSIVGKPSVVFVRAPATNVNLSTNLRWGETPSSPDLLAGEDSRARRSLTPPVDGFMAPMRFDEKWTLSTNANRIRTSALVQNARGLIDLDEFDRPEAQLKEILKLNAPGTTTNRPAMSPGRAAIYLKLESIILDEVGFDGVALSEVVRRLVEETGRRDPSGRGVNFIINSQLPGAGEQMVGLVSGVPAPPASVDLNKVIVRINPPLRHVRLADVIDAVTKAADTPLKYSVEEYAVVLTQKFDEPRPLFTRTFKVDPNTFLKNLTNQPVGAAVGTNVMDNLRSFFRNWGIDFVPSVSSVNRTGGDGLGNSVPFGEGLAGTRQPAQTSGPIKNNSQIRGKISQADKAMFFSDRTGLLLVRATMADLDAVEQAIQVLNSAPPQVQIEVKMVELTEADGKSLGFDWFLGSSADEACVITLRKESPHFYLDAQAITIERLKDELTARARKNPKFTVTIRADKEVPMAEFVKVFDAAKAATVTSVQVVTPTTDGGPLETNGIPQSVAGGVFPRSVMGGTNRSAAMVTGILTDPQFRVVLRALEQRTGVDVLSLPAVTTVSGQKARIAVTESKTVVFAKQPDASATGTTPTSTNAASAAFETRPVSVGPSVELTPVVMPDGVSIQLTMMPNLVEFLGYDDPGPFRRQAQSPATGESNSPPLTAQQPLPRFRVRQTTASATVLNGQTVVLGGVPDLAATNIIRWKDKVPVLGDIPLLGRFFRREGTSTVRKNLVIFVTPTIIDPAGNPVHPPAR